MQFDRDFFIVQLESHFLTYADMAERVGVTKNTVARWASGRMEPSKHSMLRIAEALGVEPWQLVKEDEGVRLDSIGASQAVAEEGEGAEMHDDIAQAIYEEEQAERYADELAEKQAEYEEEQRIQYEEEQAEKQAD